MIDLGDTIPFAADVYDANGALANAQTVTLTITLPDATTVTPTITNPPASTGHYGYDYPTVQAGPHDGRWQFTFAGGLTTSHSEHYDVRSTRSVVSLAAVKEQLRITSTTEDERLRAYIEAVTEVMERETGKTLVRTTFTEYHKLNGPLILIHTPVLSLTSVATVDGSTTWNVANLHVDPPTGIVTATTGSTPSGHVRAVYVAGAVPVAAGHLLAASMIVQDLWVTQRATKGSPRVGGTDEQPYQVDIGFVTRRVRELLGRRGPLVA